jgi:DNA-binding response OmpR family regulator
MALVTILLIASTRAKDDKFLTALQKQYHILTARSARQGLALVKERPPAAIVLNAVSLRTTGERICRDIKTALQTVPLVHIHPGPRDRVASVADTVVFYPLSARRLIKCIEQLISVDEAEFISCGPFRMHVPRRVLIAHGKETHLSPKLALLVETFLRNPGQIMDRKTLMETVWQTDYLGDTRTLDVHIRWIRKVMENGSRNPRYLKTVRGVGYRLALPEEIES